MNDPIEEITKREAEVLLAVFPSAQREHYRASIDESLRAVAKAVAMEIGTMPDHVLPAAPTKSDRALSEARATVNKASEHLDRLIVQRDAILHPKSSADLAVKIEQTCIVLDSTKQTVTLDIPKTTQLIDEHFAGLLNQE